MNDISLIYAAIGRRQCESYYLCHVCSRVCVVATSRSSFDVHRIVIRHDTIRSLHHRYRLSIDLIFPTGELWTPLWKRRIPRVDAGVGIRSMPPISRTFGGGSGGKLPPFDLCL
jgi:hypothetical protein